MSNFFLILISSPILTKFPRGLLSLHFLQSPEALVTETECRVLFSRYCNSEPVFRSEYYILHALCIMHYAFTPIATEKNAVTN